VIGLRSRWRLNFIRSAARYQPFQVFTALTLPVSSLKDPSFRRPIKLISIAHRKSLPPFKSDKALLLSSCSLLVTDKTSLYRIIRSTKANLNVYGDLSGGSFSGCSRRREAGVKATGRAKRRIYGVPENELPDTEREKASNYGVFD
jgi:hypothetical protein